MKVILVITVFILCAVSVSARAWQDVRNPFQFIAPQPKIHTVSDCMHVTSEDGTFVYIKRPRMETNLLPPYQQQHHNHLQPPYNSPHQPELEHLSNDQLFDDKPTDIDNELIKPTMSVCGIYFVTDPDKVVEVQVQSMDVDCDTGGLMAFVDGWELNGEYFPSKQDHHLPLDARVDEFCNDHAKWPFQSYKKVYRSSQNAALLQYRIPLSGSFMVSVRYRHNPRPCHIMAEGVAPYYTLKNHGYAGNCTLSALFPAVVSVLGLKVGETEKLNYDCDASGVHDKLTVGGTSGLNSYDMDKSTVICGASQKPGPEQAIFCGTTTVRLESSGRVHNEALIRIRTADENDLDIATLVCPM